MYIYTTMYLKMLIKAYPLNSIVQSCMAKLLKMFPVDSYWQKYVKLLKYHSFS